MYYGPHRRRRRIWVPLALFAAAFLLALVLVMLLLRLYGELQPLPKQTPEVYPPNAVEASAEAELPAQYRLLTEPEREDSGLLTLVGGEHAFDFSALLPLENIYAGMSDSYSVRDTEMLLSAEALSALNEIDGKAVTEDIVNDIFSHFCVGK